MTKTKFIIITHHALTMSKMNRLYGVTMPEKGISKLSCKFRKSRGASRINIWMSDLEDIKTRLKLQKKLQKKI